MARHVENALTIAHHLEAHELASNVRYAGLGTSRYHALTEKYLPRGAGAVFSFDIRGGREAGQEFIRGITLWSHLANVGDAKSLVIHPASTTHQQMSVEDLAKAGVGEELVRLSIGLEDAADLTDDLGQALAASQKG